MTPSLAFWLPLAVKMAVTVTFVVGASLTAQRAGPLIGAMVATLPISAGPIYVFLALDHDANFIAQSALGSLAITAATGMFSLAYAVLAERRGLVVSLVAALTLWFAVAAAIRAIDWNVLGAVLFCAVVYVPSLLLCRPYRHAVMPPAGRRWYDLPLRASMVAALVCVVVMLSPYLGPFGSGVLAVFPVVLTSLILILHPRVGARATAAVIANTISGMVGFVIGLAALHLAAVPLGVWTAFALTLTISVGWNLLVWAARRRGLAL